jgi:hypothetical protein
MPKSPVSRWLKIVSRHGSKAIGTRYPVYGRGQIEPDAVEIFPNVLNRRRTGRVSLA